MRLHPDTGIHNTFAILQGGLPSFSFEPVDLSTGGCDEFRPPARKRGRLKAKAPLGLYTRQQIKSSSQNAYPILFILLFC